MQSRRLGQTGLTVSRLGLGTMGWGSEVDEPDAAAQLDAFLDAGGTLVDTAAGYCDGESERILGGLLAGPVRSQVVLATKAGISRRGGERVVDTSRRALLDSLDGSLRRLGVDHVDLWQVHAWGAAPLEETLGALDTAVASGRVRYVGISNYTGWQTGPRLPGSAPGPGGRRWPAPRSNGRCCGAGSRPRWSRPQPTTASVCWRGPRWPVGC